MKKDDTFKMVATTLQGLEDVLAVEIKKLGGQRVVIKMRAVEYWGDTTLLYKSNYLLRTALRILKPIYSFRAKNEHELYDGIYKVWWHKRFHLEQTFAINASVTSEYFNHSKYVALKTKDAIADQFRENKRGRRPSVNPEHPDIRINIRIDDDWVLVSLDSSGDPLFKRGYRKQVSEAPMNEVLAAGIIQMGGWDKKSDFIDPMCGSGTLAIEAALLATKKPSQYYRHEYCFFNWPDFDADLWESVKTKAQQHKTNFTSKVYAFDKMPKAISTARYNIEGAGVEDVIELNRRNFIDSKPANNNSFIAMNPPYGERIQEDNLEDLYRQIGDTLKFNYKGCTAIIFSGALKEVKLVGLKPIQKYKMLNGSLDSELSIYKIFEGTLKDYKQKKEKENTLREFKD